MNNPVKVPPGVMTGIEKLLEIDTVNRFDIDGVLTVAFELKEVSAALWIMDNPEDWRRGISDGFEADPSQPDRAVITFPGFLSPDLNGNLQHQPDPAEAPISEDDTRPLKVIVLDETFGDEDDFDEDDEDYDDDEEDDDLNGSDDFGFIW